MWLRQGGHGSMWLCLAPILMVQGQWAALEKVPHSHSAEEDQMTQMTPRRLPTFGTGQEAASAASAVMGAQQASVNSQVMSATAAPNVAPVTAAWTPAPTLAPAPAPSPAPTPAQRPAHRSAPTPAPVPEPTPTPNGRMPFPPLESPGGQQARPTHLTTTFKVRYPDLPGQSIPMAECAGNARGACENQFGKPDPDCCQPEGQGGCKQPFLYSQGDICYDTTSRSNNAYKSCCLDPQAPAHMAEGAAGAQSYTTFAPEEEHSTSSSFNKVHGGLVGGATGAAAAAATVGIGVAIAQSVQQNNAQTNAPPPRLLYAAQAGDTELHVEDRSRFGLGVAPSLQSSVAPGKVAGQPHESIAFVGVIAICTVCACASFLVSGIVYFLSARTKKASVQPSDLVPDEQCA